MVDYEIVRYDVSCTTKSGKHIHVDTFFQEEEAVEYAWRYGKLHPDVKVNVYRIQRAILNADSEEYCGNKNTDDGSLPLLSEGEFVEEYCHNCGSQRCEGPGTPWFDGCHYRNKLDTTISL